MDPLRAKVYNKLYEPCVQNIVSATWQAPVSSWVVIAVCIIVAFVIVVLLIIFLFRAKVISPQNAERDPLMKSTTYNM